MLTLKQKNRRYYYPLLTNPISRVMKAELFITYFNLIDKRESVLDYGSGDGPYKKMLEEYFNKYVSADFYITNQHHSMRPDIIIDENQNIQTESNAYSCVVLSEVLEHIYYPHKALAEIYRILEPNGFAIGTVPFFMWEHEKPYDFHRYTYFGLKKMFEENGFKIIKLEYVGDNLGVLTYLFSKVFGVFLKPLTRIKPLHFILYNILKLPSYFYYLLTKMIFFKRLLRRYLGEYPFGFVFVLKKI